MNEVKIKKYSLDTSAMLQISRMYPADRSPDLFSRVWEKIELAAGSGQIIVIDKVYNELLRKDDFARRWLLERKKIIIHPCDAEVISMAADVVRDFPKLIDPDSEHEQADPYLVAHALMRGYVVVTCELAQKPPLDPKRKKDKIPNVCDHYGIEKIYPKIGAEVAITEFFEALGF